jgi:hypothetical protein
MKPPICKVCGSPHWTYEEHKPTTALEEVRKLGADVLRNDALPAMPVETIPVRVAATVVDYVPTPPPDVPLNPTISGRNKRTRGRPRKWASEAERKRAYRSRHGD